MYKKMALFLFTFLFFNVSFASASVKAWKLFFNYNSGQITYLGALREQVPETYFKVEGSWQSVFFNSHGKEVLRTTFRDPRPVLHFDGLTADGKMTGGQQIMDQHDAPFSLYVPFVADITRGEFSRRETGNPKAADSAQREDRLLKFNPCLIDLKVRYRNTKTGR